MECTKFEINLLLISSFAAFCMVFFIMSFKKEGMNFFQHTARSTSSLGFFFIAFYLFFYVNNYPQTLCKLPASLQTD